jgi:hypothetical protein
MGRVRVGVQLSQQATTIDELRAAWREADEIVDPLRRILT